MAMYWWLPQYGVVSCMTGIMVMHGSDKTRRKKSLFFFVHVSHPFDVELDGFNLIFILIIILLLLHLLLLSLLSPLFSSFSSLSLLLSLPTTRLWPVYLASGIWHLVSGIWSLVPGYWC